MLGEELRTLGQALDAEGIRLIRLLQEADAYRVLGRAGGQVGGWSFSLDELAHAHQAGLARRRPDP